MELYEEETSNIENNDLDQKHVSFINSLQKAAEDELSEIDAKQKQC